MALYGQKRREMVQMLEGAWKLVEHEDQFVATAKCGR
jgi:hypothetical protein